MREGKKCKVTNFGDPHLFFVLYDDNQVAINDLEKNLEKRFINTIEQFPKADQIYVVKHEGKYKRAVALSKPKSYYFCWLVDYGELVWEKTLYTLPAHCDLKPLSIKAGLNKTVGLETYIGETGNIEFKTSNKFSSGACNAVKNLIRSAKEVYFKEELVVSNVHFGEIYLIMKDGSSVNLIENVKKKQTLAVDETLFNKMIAKSTEFIDYKHLPEDVGVGRGYSRNSRKLLAKPIESSEEQVKSWLASTSHEISVLTESCASHMPDSSDTDSNPPESKENILLKKTPQSVMKMRESLDSSKQFSVSDVSFNSSKQSWYNGKTFKPSKQSSDSDATFNLNKESFDNSATFSSSKQSLNNGVIFNSRKQSLNMDATFKLSKQSSDCGATFNSSTQSLNNGETFNSRKQSVGTGATFNSSKQSSDCGATFNSSTQSLDNGPTFNSRKQSVGTGATFNSSKQSLNNGTTCKLSKQSSDSDSTFDSSKQSLDKGAIYNSSRQSSNNGKQSLHNAATFKPSKQSFDSDATSKSSKQSLDSGTIFRPTPKDILQECKSSNSSIMSAIRKMKLNSNSVRSTSSDVSAKTTDSDSEIAVSETSERFLKNTDDSEEESFVNNDKSVVKNFRCNCADCVDWDEMDFDTKPEEFKVRKIKCIVRPGLLMREEDQEKNPCLKSSSELDEFSTLKKMSVPNILVHGIVIPFPQKYVTDVPFIEPIHRSLRTLKIEKCMHVQQYGWPAIMRGMNLCVVNIANNGKTMTYVAALCSLLMEADRYHSLPNDNGPKAIVLCTESRDVEKVYKKFYDVQANSRSPIKLKFIQAIAPLNPPLMSQFKSAHDVLITTPAVLITFLSKNTFNLKRLCHLVVENVDEIFRSHMPLDRILNVVQEMLKHRTCSKQVQFVCTAQHWTSPIENLMKRMNSVPLIVIGNPIEAAMYGRSDICIVEVQSNSKHSKLYDIIKDNYRVYKTLVVCKKEEIKALEELFQLSGISMLIADESMTGQDIIEIHKSWNSRSGGEHVVLICTDFVLMTQMNVRDCSILVNYTLQTSWTNFVKRWSCLIDNYKCPLNDNRDSFTCKIYVFIDENSGKEITKIVSYFQTLGITLPSNIIEYCEKYKNSVEKQKIKDKLVLCQNWKQKTICSTSNCPNRHILNPELDNTSSRNISGTLKFQVDYINSVNSFKIVPRLFKTGKGEVHEFNDTRPEIERLLKGMKMKEFAMNIEVGGMYLLEEDGMYIRCVVKRIVEHDLITKMASKVLIEGVDRGCCKRVLTGNLFEMPDNLKDIPSSLMELIIVNITPLNKEKSWSDRARKQLVNIFDEHKNANNYYTGKVALHIGNTVWMENFQIHLQLSTVEQPLTCFTLLPYLTKENIAKVEKSQLAKFYEECDKYGLPKPEYDMNAEVKVVVKQAQPQWAFLPDEGFNPVTFSSGFSPRKFFVKLKKFSDLYMNLEDSIKKLVQQRALHLKPEEIIAGNYYLAPDPEDESVYSRAIVTNVMEETADCFYVDFGDVAYISLKDIKFLPDDYITRLPFQCIECSLHGVDPVEEEWTDSALDILYQYCFESNSSDFRTLYTLTMREEAGNYLGNTKYTVQLYYYLENVQKMINSVMIDSGVAIPNRNEPLDLEAKLVVEVNQGESDEDRLEEEGERVVVDVSSEDEIDNFDFVYPDGHEFFTDIGFKIPQPSNAIRSKEPSSNKQIENSLPEEPPSNKQIEDSLPNEPSSSKQTEGSLPEMKALPLSHTYTPSVEWYQTDDIVKLWIKVPVPDYQIKLISRRILSFSTEYSDRIYTLKLSLFDLVQKSIRHEAGAFSVNVVLTKIKQVEWPRLILSSEANKKIKYNVDKLQVSDDEDYSLLDRVMQRKKKAAEAAKADEDDEDYYDELGSDYSDSDFSDSSSED